MQVIVNGRHIDVTDALRNYAESKVKKIEKYLPGTTEAVVTLSVQKYRHNAEILIKVNGLLIQAEDETGEMYSAIDKVMDKIERQVKRYKEKLLNRHKNSESIKAASEEAVEEAVDKDMPKIIKTKRFALKPMLPDEAVMQMELLHKDFFVFTNAGDNKVNVIYRRRDGNIGLIEPIA
ncbi:MAG: ribosomal subunit interface protein [Nitrospirae bacterium RBG_19FT_COMBO_42_15]|nr:MAG: ribosomal subunit interface protein [Nitrospirae bacterium RBG_19FT_COMBO_42_15]